MGAMEPLSCNSTERSVATNGDETVVDLAVVFEALYATEWSSMVQLAVAMVDDRGRASEIVQDAFERLYLRWDRVGDRVAYVRTAVVNGCRSELRRRAVMRRHPPAPPATAAMPERNDELIRAVRRLGARQRIALTLRFYGDLTMDDIAAAMGVRPGTARSLVSRGLADLRKALAEENAR